MRRFPFLSPRLTAAICLFIFVAVAAGCSRTPHPKRWWEFWRKKPVYTEEVGLYPPPDIASTELTEPSTLPGEDESIPETEPIRQEPSSMVSELETVHFDYDSYQLPPDMQEQLRQNAAWIKSHPGITIQIEGHCDERGTTEYNMALGQKRADTVREFLAREGVDPQTLVTISYGEERPLPDALGHDDESWAQNRRVSPKSFP